MIIAVPNDGLWRKMCDALELTELKDHPKYAVNVNRVANREELVGILTEYTKQRESIEIINKLKKAGVPSGPINNIAELLEHPQVHAREMIQEVDHPTIGKLKMLGVPLKLSDTPGSVRKAPPLLGENTDEVLELLGYSSEEITNLKEKGII